MAQSVLAQEGISAEIIVEDDMTTPSKAVSSFLKLVMQDKVQGIVGGTWDFLAESIYPSAERLKIPFVTPTNPVEILSPTALKNHWVFTNGLSVASTVKAIKTYWLTHRPQSIGFVVIKVPYGLVLSSSVKSIASEMKIPISFTKEITFEGLADDIKLAALESKRLNVETLFVVLDGRGIDLLTRKLDELAINPKLLTTSNLKDAYKLTSSKERYNNAVGVFQKVPDDQFGNLFQIKYGRSPGEYAANGYDATLCLARALSKKIFTASSYKYDCSGVTGMHHFTNTSRSLLESTAEILKFSEKGFVPVQ